MSQMDNRMTLPSTSAPEFDVRDGEQKLAFDPALAEKHAGLVFIGHVASPWARREDCPKNMRAAGEKGGGGQVLLHPAYRAGLAGLEACSHAILLTWLDRSPRDLIVQKPRHAPSPSGTFALRSPVRPNPIGLHVVRITGMDHAGGTIELESVDVLDGTPLVDIKPYFASTDAVPDAMRAARPDL